MAKTKAVIEERRDATKRAAIAYIDLQDQPVGKYYLLIDWGIGGKSTFQVDGVNEGAHSIIGYMETPYNPKWPERPPISTIASFNKEIPWAMVAREYVDVITMDELVRREAADEKSLRGMIMTIRGKDADQTFPTLKGHEHSTLSLDNKEPLPIGQYL